MDGAVPIKTSVKYRVDNDWFHQICFTFQGFTRFIGVFCANAMKRKLDKFIGFSQSEDWFWKRLDGSFLVFGNFHFFFFAITAKNEDSKEKNKPVFFHLYKIFDKVYDGMPQLFSFSGFAIFKGHFIKVKNLDKDKKNKKPRIHK
tara:strand:+ start:9005 stop:9439 length:435 start_codon:yes stop_codon:yes gene_type:complete